MKFVLNRNKTVSSDLGHSIEFRKGVPTHVPREMHEAVLAVGAEPQEALPDEPGPKDSAPAEQAARDDAIRAACETVATRNAREDFGANGVPTFEALEKLLGWKPNKRERDAVWAKLRLGEGE